MKSGPTGLFVIIIFFLECSGSIAFPIIFNGCRRLPFGFAHRTNSRAFSQSCRIFSSCLGFSSSPEKADSEATDEDLSRWERMYEAGEMAVNGGLDDVDFSSFEPQSEVRVVSFDLDNTLWKTSGCINKANDVLSEYLSTYQIQQPMRVEKVMGNLFKDRPKDYCPLLEDGEEPKGPTLLTKLRTDALVHVLTEFNDYSSEDANAFAKEAFKVWTQARHDAIPENLAAEVVECLERISSIRSSDGNPVLIGAITDGNSDPRRVKSLAKYFDFVVNAESVGVSKPDRRVYEAAIQKIKSLAPVKDLLWGTDGEIYAGAYWVHVGDDFVKDIVAAKTLKMRTVWALELVKDKLQPSKNDQPRPQRQSDDKEIQQFVKDVSDKKVLQMSIGADSYLADTFTKEFVDEVAEQFSELGNILSQWNREGLDSAITKQGLRSKLKKSTPAPESNDAEVVMPQESSDFLSVVMPSTNNPTSTTVPARAFRIIRETFSTDVLAPIQSRDAATMQDVMGIAQLDKTSGVFAFAGEDVEELRIGKKSLQIKIEGTGLEFSREVFVRMSVEDVLSLTDENPVRISLSLKAAPSAPSFDLF